jgi:thioredoxin 1
MKRNSLVIALALLIAAGTAGCGKESRAERDSAALPPAGAEPAAQSKGAPASSDYGKVLVTNRLDIDFSKHLVTFIEIGADRCIPCIQMQPIMKEIAEQYADRVQVVFYDVWKDPTPARKYGIQLIPTQVFVDQKGKEIFRHVGFFAKDEIVELLKKHGVH